MNDSVLLDIHEGVATLTLNRPEQGNAIDLPMAQALLRAAIVCDQTPDLKCVVLTGSGKLFCAGGDLQAFTEAGDGISGFLSELAGTLHLAISRLMRMNKPLLTLVNGAAAGAGLSLALIGDIVLAEPAASFTPAYGAIGLSPDGGLSWILPRLTGLRRAQELILLNQRLSAAQAHGLGLVSRVVEAGQLQAEGARVVATLVAMNPAALGSVRRLLLESHGTPLETQLENEARSIAALAAQPCVRDKVAAFVAQRLPKNKKELSHG
ncbi:enoyl-CoA hydratase/isomerase family protein [Pseudomonas sp. 5P_5.1_Bac1]|uniref:enoyl-CoA hydratase/isomerase family protein n=1 Tax=Pseudomonas sp. 5P_5.1_Bac1 TaxID=2971616 RepID=UPI0021C7EAE0|nr:enoyl-CoA hydratase-related protein [Pseudomonas sp. 5P_5.1_Bac1]MCU1724790.1 enoyl-CoA hydratase-related protein [Pseudomonas sp. 5P_5.1_Bac1]